MCPKISKKSLSRTIETIHDDLVSKFKISKPKITVTGLNPHSGEKGEFGDEEIKNNKTNYRKNA